MRKRHLMGILFILAAAALSSRTRGVDPTPSPTPSAVPAAMAKLQQGDAAGAAKILEEVVAHDPRNAQAWRGLGIASVRLKNFDRAEEAFRKTLDIEPGSPRAMYNLGVVAARRQNTDAAFEWLRKARATRNRHDLRPGRRGPREPAAGSSLRIASSRAGGFRAARLDGGRRRRRRWIS